MRKVSISESQRVLVLHQVLRFLAAGGAAALINFFSRLLFSQVMRFEYAIVCAFFVGLTAGFLLFRQYVFGASGRGLGREAAFFVAVNLFALLQTWLVSVYLAAFLAPHLGGALAEATAHGTGVLVPALSSYFGHRFLTFRQ